MKKFNILLVIAMLFSMVSFAQKDRFLKPIFGSVKSTMGITYCENYTFEPFLLQQPNTHTKKIPLKCDFYEPTGDASKKRPLVIFLHTGNFIPQPSFGGSPEGRTTDSVLVELSTRLAKMGYACASADYRIGWAPTSTDETTRKFTLITAAYRGIQDVRSCVLFFKKNADQYGIDTSRITVFGSGTGGYIALGVASLDKYPEIFANTTPAGKFLLSTNPLTPMVIEGFNGNINGTNFGKAAVNFGVPAGDTLCIPSNLGPTSNVQLVTNLGGALGDLSWVDKNSVPTISFHTTNDFYAPYSEAILKVPVSATVIFDIVNVMGSYKVQKKQDSLTINSKWKALKLNDVYSQAANKVNDGFDGLYPVTGLKPTDSSPWNWWDVAFWSAKPHPSVPGASIHQVALQAAPLTTAARAKLYCDTIVGYFAPRAYAQLDLAKLLVATTFSVDMKNETVDAAKGVCVAGDFQKDAGFASDWTPGITKLVNKAGTSVWELTVDLPAGKAYKFKFINDNGWNGKEEKNVGCNAGGDDRQFTVGAAATTVGTFCYNKCFACDEFAVRLNVDMTKVATISPDGVHVAGEFQGWNPAVTRLSQVGTTKVYTALVGMKAGAQPYKFVNGNAWGKDEVIAAGAWCNKPGSTDRLLTVTKDVVMSEVCFGDCNTCAKIGTNDANFDSAVSVFPNPTAGDVTVAYNFSEEVSNINVRIFNSLGQVIAERAIKNAFAGNTSFNLNNMPAGFYTVVISNGSAFSSKRIIVQK